MSWVQENQKSWLQKWCGNILKAGPVPKHVAFIMDGNRRFARKNSIERAEGHLEGFNRLANTLEWCLDLGITEVTVYAFSIENFKRPRAEVDGLMELARQKFARLLQERDLIDKHGVCVRVIGNMSLLPEDLQILVAETVNCSRNNTKATLNVCLAYTSQEEICNAMKECIEGVELGIIKESDIDEEMLANCLYTNHSQDPDLLVRTSGEVRLSDFLLWQSSYSVLSFMKVLWPEFSVWNLYAGVLHYQRHYEAIQDAKLCHKKDLEQKRREEDQQIVLQELAKQDIGINNIQQLIQEYSMKREDRVQAFLKHLAQKREQILEKLCSKLPKTFNTNTIEKKCIETCIS